MKRDILKSTQEQAVGAWVDFLNQIRFNTLVATLIDIDTAYHQALENNENQLADALRAQRANLESALASMAQLKAFISDPSHILGSAKTKHGEIAEQAQVAITNARNLLRGLQGEYTFEGVGRTAPEDYLKNGMSVQAKFYNGAKNTVNAIRKHLEKYPDFLQNGGIYEIPSDQFEFIMEILSRPSSQRSRTEETLVRLIRLWEQTNDVTFSEVVKPTVVTYSSIQVAVAGATADAEEASLKQTNDEIEAGLQQEKDAQDGTAAAKRDADKQTAVDDSKPTLREAGKAVAVGAALEGGMAFCMGLYQKRKEGKRLRDFTSEDWKGLGCDTAKGSAKGGVRGGAVYGLTNFANMPGGVASAYVTAAMGITGLASAHQKGLLDDDEFFLQSEVLCMDVTVSAISATLGQVVIPIPILGALIGNVAGMTLYGLAKNSLSAQEQLMLENYALEMKQLNVMLDERLQALIQKVEAEFKRFSSLVDLAFDEDINLAFTNSVALARHVGVEEDSILKTKDDIDRFFTA